MRGGGFLFDSPDEKVYKKFKEGLTDNEKNALDKDEVKTAKQTMKANLKALLDNASKIDYKEMLMNRLPEIMKNKLVIKQTTDKAGKPFFTLDSNSLTSMIPTNINITDSLNKQIDTMLGSTQPQSHLSQSYPYRPRSSTFG